MRSFAWAVVAFPIVIVASVGCGGRSPLEPPGDRPGGGEAGATFGAAGAVGAGVAGDGAGGTGPADTGVAGGAATGEGGVAGTGGLAGDGSMSGTAGNASTAGAAGDGSGNAIGAGGMGAPSSSGEGGSSGSVLPVPSPCDTLPKKPLPYAIGVDFSSIVSINNPGLWTPVASPDCDQAAFPVPPASVGAPFGGPAPSPGSACYEFIYDPDFCLGATPDLCWAGAIFEPPPAFGPSGPGICIEDGATMIEFWARSSRDGARVKFGSIRPGLGSTEFFINLTTTWTRYTVAIPVGEPYNTSALAGGVWNGFSVVAEPQDHAGGSYILVRDIRWLK
jgi:hypothetical protein